MIERHATSQRLREFAADLCVIGAGLVGIITTLALADRGFRVVLLESGWSRPRPEVQALSEAHNVRPDNLSASRTAVKPQPAWHSAKSRPSLPSARESAGVRLLRWAGQKATP